MKLLRETFVVHLLRRLLAGRGNASVRRAYAVTVPAPRCPPAGNVVELRAHARSDEGGRLPRRPPTDRAARRVVNL